MGVRVLSAYAQGGAFDEVSKASSLGSIVVERYYRSAEVSCRMGRKILGSQTRKVFNLTSCLSFSDGRRGLECVAVSSHSACRYRGRAAPSPIETSGRTPKLFSCRHLSKTPTMKSIHLPQTPAFATLRRMCAAQSDHRHAGHTHPDAEFRCSGAATAHSLTARPAPLTVACERSFTHPDGETEQIRASCL